MWLLNWLRGRLVASYLVKLAAANAELDRLHAAMDEVDVAFHGQEDVRSTVSYIRTAGKGTRLLWSEPDGSMAHISTAAQLLDAQFRRRQVKANRKRRGEYDCDGWLGT